MGLFTSEIKHNVEAQSRVRAWIERLKSGQDPQTNKVLRDHRGFCCLGVACELHDPSRWTPAADGRIRGWYVGHGLVEAMYLPGEVAESLCIRTTAGRYGPHTGESLMAMNDERVPFPQIGDFIEQQLDAALAA